MFEARRAHLRVETLRRGQALACICPAQRRRPDALHEMHERALIGVADPEHLGVDSVLHKASGQLSPTLPVTGFNLFKGHLDLSALH